MKLKIQNVTKKYGNKTALNDVSIELNEGIYALLGPNGSGKTTLMNIITENISFNSGKIIYADEDGVENSIFDKKLCFREKIGFMPQYPGMYPFFTARQFLQYMALLKDMGRELGRKERQAFIDGKINEILSEVTLDKEQNKKIKTFSGGMKQRLALAAAVIGEPDILILDEPTAGLDPQQRILIRNFISRIALNKIVIIATHIVSDIESISKKVILLKEGQVIELDSPRAIANKMNGKVWEICVTENEIEALQKSLNIINISKADDGERKVLLRVISDTCPCENARALTPMLEDYYLNTFGKV